ncbi:SprT-like domain-containing protein (plasmid) [Escherichia coli]
MAGANIHNPTTQAYMELQAAYDHYNAELFGGELPFCLITMQREKRTYGYFSHRRFVHRGDKENTTDEIAINPAYFGVVPQLEILQTVVHEMVHLWQFHFGKPGRRGYHNKEWADKMENIGLMPSSTGEPGGKRVGEKMADYAIAGGPFMKATEKLLQRNFQISWLDRQPPERLVGAGQQQLAALPEEFAEAAIGEVAELGELLEPLPGNRSNRKKYRCPGCGAQVWGKPGLRVLCGNDTCNLSEFGMVD